MVYGKGRKKKIAPSSKEELKALVEQYFSKGGVIKVCPTRYTDGFYNSRQITAKKGTY